MSGEVLSVGVFATGFGSIPVCQMALALLDGHVLNETLCKMHTIITEKPRFGIERSLILILVSVQNGLIRSHGEWRNGPFLL